MLKNEWKKLLSNRLMLVVVLAVIAIPTIYTTLFLGSMWDPYGSVENLPVALVNEDRPVEYEGKTLDVGGQLVENLQRDASLDFRLTDAGEAARGLAEGPLLHGDHHSAGFFRQCGHPHRRPAP